MKQAKKAQTKQDAENTFEVVAHDWIAHARDKWSPGHEARILANFKADVFPAIGARAIAEISPADVKALLKKLEMRGVGGRASRTRMRIRAVFRFATVHGRIKSNPMVEKWFDKFDSGLWWLEAKVII